MNIDFDKVAFQYEELVYKYIPFGKFLFKKKDKLKIRLIKSLAPTSNSILDFGCGVGLLLPLIFENYPESEIYAYDESVDSLNIALCSNETIKSINPFSKENNKIKIDLIIASCVFHHIEPYKRLEVIKQLLTLTNQGGSICIIEHNPLNLITKLIVRLHPIDKNVKLLSPCKTKDLLTTSKMICNLHYYVPIPFTSFFILIPDIYFLRNFALQYCLIIKK